MRVRLQFKSSESSKTTYRRSMRSFSVVQEGLESHHMDQPVRLEDLNQIKLSKVKGMKKLSQHHQEFAINQVASKKYYGAITKVSEQNVSLC